MATETQHSVSLWIVTLKKGDVAAAQPLWERYYERLVRVARGKLVASSAAADEEDVALSAFNSFGLAATAGRFPDLSDRDDLWKLLVSLTTRKSINLRKHVSRKKRGGGRVLDEGALAAANLRVDSVGLDALIGDEPTPALAAEVAENCRVLLDVLDGEDPKSILRSVAVWKLEGYTNREIADKLDCALRTVANRLELIRSLWAGFVEP
jgi:DNA-directed RNA polymerase specialized sigma24 family protein